MCRDFRRVKEEEQKDGSDTRKWHVNVKGPSPGHSIDENATQEGPDDGAEDDEEE